MRGNTSAWREGQSHDTLTPEADDASLPLAIDLADVDHQISQLLTTLDTAAEDTSTQLEHICHCLLRPSRIREISVVEDGGNGGGSVRSDGGGVGGGVGGGLRATLPSGQALRGRQLARAKEPLQAREKPPFRRRTALFRRRAGDFGRRRAGFMGGGTPDAPLASCSRSHSYSTTGCWIAAAA